VGLCPPKSVIDPIEKIPHHGERADLAYRGAPGLDPTVLGVDGAISISRSCRSGTCEAPARVMRLHRQPIWRRWAPAFAGKEWVVAPETALAETDSLRRVDLVMKYFGNESLEVLCFHELKRIIASPTDLEEVEYQAFKACIAYLAQHPKVSTVYAITSFGTKARGWTCTKDSDYLEPL
jgi:hypothetical protein